MPVISPLTREQYEKRLDDPALCEQLPVRDYLDNVLARTSGALVAGYELRGITSYFASDEERDRAKVMLGALLKSIPEQSMRLQVRYEEAEDVGNQFEVYTAQDRSGSEIGRTLDAVRLEAWEQRLKLATISGPCFTYTSSGTRRYTTASQARQPDAAQVGAFLPRPQLSETVASTKSSWRSLKACWLALRPLCRRQSWDRAG
jgi:hypothetical protein